MDCEMIDCSFALDEQSYLSPVTVYKRVSTQRDMVFNTGCDHQTINRQLNRTPLEPQDLGCGLLSTEISGCHCADIDTICSVCEHESICRSAAILVETSSPLHRKLALEGVSRAVYCCRVWIQNSLPEPWNF